MPSRSVHVVSNGKITFFMAKKDTVLFRYIYHIFFIHSSMDEHLGCFTILAIINNAEMNMGLHISFTVTVFIIFQINTQK